MVENTYIGRNPKGATELIEKFNANPDSNSGVLTQPKVIEAGETVTIKSGRQAILADTVVDGDLVIEAGGEVFIPAGSTFGDLDQRINTKLDKDFSSFTDKPTPDDTDSLVLQEAGGDLKKVSYENLIKLNPNDLAVKTALNASGSGPIYACRAYGYANHQTNTLINGSGISSITDAGAGQIYFNLVVPSPDIKYTVLATVGGSIGGSGNLQPTIVTNQKSITQFDVVTTGASGYAYADNTQVYVAVFY